MIYVDDWQQAARVGRLTAKWSHLTCGPFDDLAELHAFATRIGLRRSWFQEKPWPRAHYDVTESRRQAAIVAGAVVITWRDAGLHMMQAVEAWKQAAGGAPRPSGPDGNRDLWDAAAVLYHRGVLGSRAIQGGTT